MHIYISTGSVESLRCALFIPIWSQMSSQFADKFAEYKEAARLAKEKSLEKKELASSPSQVGMVSL